MSKKRRNLIFLVCATLVMGLLLWLVMRDDANNYVHEHNEEEVSESDDAAVSGTLINEEPDTLKKIVFTNKYNTYNVTINKEKGAVEFEELKGLPVNESFMEYVWYGASKLSYNRIVTNTGSEKYRASDYGLDKPSLSVTASFSNGKTYKFIAGKNAVGEDDDVYYLKMNGDNNIYTATLETSFFMGDSYYLSDDIFYSYDKSLNSQGDVKIGDITLTGKKFSQSFVMKRNTIANKSDPLYGYDYVVDSPVKWSVKSNSAALIVHELTYLTADEAVLLNPNEKQLKSYGFKTPTCTISFTRNGKNCTLYVGKITKSVVYFMLKGQPIIYSVDIDGLSVLHKLEPNNIYNDKALSLSVDTISSISVDSSEVKKTLTIERTLKNDELAGEAELYTYNVKSGSKEIKYSAYTLFVKQLNNSVIQAWNTAKPKGRAKIKIKVSYYKEYNRKDDVIEIYKVSDRVYAVVMNGYPVNQVSSSWVNQLIKNTDSL